MSKKIKIIIIPIIGFIIIATFGILSIPSVSKDKEVDKEYSKELLKINVLDVSQADSIFIELPNKETMLIDAGERSSKDTIEAYINNLGYSRIDYLIGTHPHADHIGSMASIINDYEIGNIYMPKALSTSKIYEELLTTINNKNMKVKNTKAGLMIVDEDNLKIKVIAPNSDSYKTLNNYSIVIKITYYDNEFLFMGDAEVLSEKEITDDVSADVIKVGHHGSITSSSTDFLNRVQPKYAIISVGENNKYKHPSEDVISRYQDIGATIYRTDLNGNIVITSNGQTIDIKTDK